MGFVKRNLTEVKVFAVFFIFAAVLTQCSLSPLIYPDEAGYIGWAYRLVHGIGDGLRYLPGYSLLIAPVIAVTNGIRTAFMLIVLVNSVIYGAFSAVCVKLAKELKFSDPLICAFAVALYPSFVLYANLAMSEVLLSLLFVLTVYSLHGFSQNVTSLKNWLFPLFFAAYSCFTHSRAIAILPALFLAMAVTVFSRGGKKMKIAFSVVCIVAFSGAGGLFFYLLSHSETVNAVHMLEQIKNLFAVSGICSFASTLVSQFSYLVMSTFGFVIIGIYYTVKSVRENKNRTAAVFVIAAFVFSALVSAVFMYHHERPDHVIYGRYNEYVISGLLLFGISGFLESGIKPRFLFFGFASVLFTACFCSESLEGFGGNMSHTWGIYLYKAFFYEFSYISASLVFVLAALIIFLIKKPKITVAALCVLFVSCALYTEYDYFFKGASLRQEYPQLAHLLKDEETVSADVIEGDSMVYPWEYYNYTVYNPGLNFAENSKFTLSRKRIPGMILAGKEKYSDIYLYTDDENIPEVDEKGEPKAKVSVISAEGKNIAVMFENKGNPWLCLDAADNTADAVRAAMRVYKEGKMIADVRQDFSDNVYDKADIIFEFPYENGEYTVVIETVREFRFRGGELSVNIEVSDSGITVEECNFRKDAGFSEFNPIEIKGVEGFYRYYVMPSGVKIPGVYLNGTFLAIETYGEHGELDVDVYGNGKELKFLGYEDNCYIYSISEPIETLEIKSSTYKYCDNCLGFLTTDTNVKIIDYFVRGMKKLFDVRLDHREYGVDIKKICIN